MATSLSTLDIVMVVLYFVVIIGVGIFASCKVSKGSVNGYFLAGRNVNFFMIGASLFVSNIGAEHFMGLAGSGAAEGIGVGAWEFIAIFGLQVLGFVFLPVYLACQTRTMPEYLHKRFGGQRIRVYYAILSLLQYILTKCSVGLFTGAVFMQQSLDLNLYVCTAILICIVAVLTLVGGLTAVLYTDTVQFFLMMGGATTLTIMGFNEVGGFEGLWRKYPLAVLNVTEANSTCGGGAIHPQWDTMLRDLSDPNLPWLGFIIGGLPGITWYLCADQVMVQRSLAAKNLSHGQSAVIMTSLFKILPFFLMVFPGMIARVLYTEEIACIDPDICFEVCQNRAGCSNIAFPRLVLGILPDGLRGLMMSVLIAAVMSDLDSFFNSASTIFAVDIWLRIRNKATTREQMIVGRLFLILIAGLSLAWVPVLQTFNSGQIFLYITEVANHLAAPSAAVFVLAALWPRANEKGAFTGLLTGLLPGIIRLALVWSYGSPAACSDEPDTRPAIIKDVPYLYVTAMQFTVSFISCVVVSLCTAPPDYKQVFRTTFWTKEDPFDPKEVAAGKIKGTWTRCTFQLAENDNLPTISVTEASKENGVVMQPLDDKDIHLKSKTDLDAESPVVIQPGSADMGKPVEKTEEKKTCKQVCCNWLCGEVPDTEKAGALPAEEEEEEEYSLHQSTWAKIALRSMGVFCLLLCGGAMGFWSLWKYTPSEVKSEL